MLKKILKYLCVHTSYPFIIAMITTVGGLVIAGQIAVFIIMTVHMEPEFHQQFIRIFILFITCIFFPGYYIHFGLLSRLGIPAFSSSLRILSANVCMGTVGKDMRNQEYLDTLRATETIARDNLIASLIYPTLVNLAVSIYTVLRVDSGTGIRLFLSILSATVVYAFFAYIIAETISGDVRGLAKQQLVAHSVSFTEKSYLSIRLKFLFISIFILISILQLWYMLVYHVSTRNNILPLVFILVTMTILILLLYLYYHSLRDALKEIEHATTDLGQGGTGKLFLHSLDREIIELSRGIISAAYEVNDVRNNLQRKVEERTLELKQAQEKIAQAYFSMKMELEMAQTIQNAIIPENFPSDIDYQFSGIYLPMHELGGDFYDIMVIDDRYLHLVIADVSGHGVSAALITMIAKLSFSTNAGRSHQPQHVVRLVNQELYRILGDLTHYLTAFYCIIDMQTHTLSYTNAGHTDVLLQSQNGGIRRLKAQSAFIGSFESVKYKKDKLILKPKDRLILFTDGILDVRNQDGLEYGQNRFEEIIRETRHTDLIHSTAAIKQDIRKFKGTQAQKDDITLFLAEFDPHTRFPH